MPDTRGHMLLDSTRWTSSGLATERVHLRHGGGRSSPHLGLGFPRGYLRGSTIARPILTNYETSLDDEGSASVGAQ